MTTIEKDTVASVHYTGTHPDSGEVFDSSRDGEPLAFLVGHANMIPGFENAMMGAKVGESRQFTLEPADAYGDIEESKVVEMPRDQFPDDVDLELGMMLMSDIGPFRIVAVTNDNVKCDFNHPMAGKSLAFDVEVMEIRAATEEETQHGHAHGPGGHHHHHEHEEKDDCGDDCGC
ncbi:MAG: peptidylprolyl isomerase [Candidatus Thalassarchaeaceae archaeon]|jgi:FKBP-type peptidyl-prolyl cis-trans isomerase SlyD|nr:peptidylprolyl isomerase [Candidatus Thalassarchaeaceae archaeon]